MEGREKWGDAGGMRGGGGQKRARMRVMTTPQGMGTPTNLWPDTDTEPIGFLNVTIGASCAAAAAFRPPGQAARPAPRALQRGQAAE